MAALGLVASAIGAVGQVVSGVAANNAAQFEAKQQKMAGQEEFAASQREAEKQRKESQYLQSRQQALAAFSGAGASDPTIVRLMSETAQQGELNAQSSLYSGTQRKRGLFDQAKGTRMSGQASLLGSFMGAAGTLASGVAKYRTDTNKVSYG